MQEYIDYLVSWLEQQRKKYKLSKYVIGVSGGIDSAVVASLLARTNTPFQALLLPSHSNASQDLQDAYTLLANLNCPVIELPISNMYNKIIDESQALLNPAADRQNVIIGNVQARLRMILLYIYAQSNDALVVGTDNAAEWYTGYFTKYGDGGVDVVPLIHLRKEQVFAMAKLLDIPKQIIDKAPSAGLWAGQTDEDELGVSYQEIDAFLRGERVSAQAEERIAFWHNRSWHKRQLPDAPLAYKDIV